SGHGARHNDQDWLVPSDGDPDNVPETAISYDRLKRQLETKRPHRVLLVMDACRNVRGGKDIAPSEFGAGAGPAEPQFAELLSCQPTEVSRISDDFKES